MCNHLLVFLVAACVVAGLSMADDHLQCQDGNGDLYNILDAYTNTTLDYDRLCTCVEAENEDDPPITIAAWACTGPDLVMSL